VAAEPAAEAGAGKGMMIEIPEENLVFKFSRSGGPGGQNVNKVNTRVTVFFDVVRCKRYSDEQKRRILKRLATRADKRGVVRVVCQRYRTQKANREGAVERLGELVGEALKKKRARRKTKVPAYAREKRLAGKKRRSEIKKQRRKMEFGD
jgi:ribosome-associated protein